MCSTAEDSLSITEIDGRGRSLITTKPLKGGEVILRDSPLLLYSALPSTEQNHRYCHRCFRRTSPNSVVTTCPHEFCGLDCYSKAITASHTPFVCQFLSHLSKTPFPHDLLVQSRFIVAAYSLSVYCPRNFELLLSLQGNHENSNVESAKLICSFLDSFAGKNCFSLEMTSALLAKDKMNAFGLMESKEKRWSVRAYGLYYKAAMFNHDCLPNACRFDYVDSERGDNTEIVIRMIHDVPEGREICLSYFPVNLSYKERQKRLLEDYGFTCCCDRCKVESNWSDNEDEDVEGEGQGSNWGE